MIVLVDDEPDVLEAMAAILELGGGRSRPFSNAEDARAWLLSGDGSRARALITDYDLPGINGLELILTVRRHRPGLRCALVSGFPRAFLKPPDDVPLLAKPFRPSALLAAAGLEPDRAG